MPVQALPVEAETKPAEPEAQFPEPVYIPTPTAPAPVATRLPEPDAPINFIEPAATRETLMEQILKQRNEPPPVYTPPARTGRQMSQLEEEMEAGRKALARHAAGQHARREVAQPIPPSPADGKMTPVYRPGDAVPGMNSGQLGARNVREG